MHFTQLLYLQLLHCFSFCLFLLFPAQQKRHPFSCLRHHSGALTQPLVKHCQQCDNPRMVEFSIFFLSVNRILLVNLKSCGCTFLIHLSFFLHTLFHKYFFIHFLMTFFKTTKTWTLKKERVLWELPLPSILGNVALICLVKKYTLCLFNYCFVTVFSLGFYCF